MFTGIITEVGAITNVSQKDEVTQLTIKANIAKEKKSGDSIAVDGACLTVVELTDDEFTTEAIPETLNKTIIKEYKDGTSVNIEGSLKVGDTLDGHLVSGHVDFVGFVKTIKKDHNTQTIRVTIPAEMRKFFALKGSVTLNGVSLTISDVAETSFTVSLIPETLNKTNLGSLAENQPVNIEIDLISRYLDSLLQGKEKEASYEFLKERGFL